MVDHQPQAVAAPSVPVRAPRASRRHADRRRRPRWRRWLDFFTTPKGLTLLGLGVLLAAALRHPDPAQLPEALACVWTACVADLALAWAMDAGWAFPSGAIITGLIVGMILAPTAPLYIPVLTVTLAIASKHVMRTRWSNVFNPAALALVGSYFLFGSEQSWWGALPLLGPAWSLFLLAIGLGLAARVNKLPAVLVYLGAALTTFAAAAFLGDAARVAEIFRAPDIQAILFFATLMLTDPPTSPARPVDQVPYALIVAAASCAAFLLWGALWFLPGGLLAGNAWESARRLAARRRTMARRARAAIG